MEDDERGGSGFRIDFREGEVDTSPDIEKAKEAIKNVPANVEASVHIEQMEQTWVQAEKKWNNQSWIGILNKAASIPIQAINYFLKTVRAGILGTRVSATVILVVGLILLILLIHAYVELTTPPGILSPLSQIVVGILFFCTVYFSLSLVWLLHARRKGYDQGNREDVVQLSNLMDDREDRVDKKGLIR